MRHGQPRLADDRISVKDEVEVERAWRTLERALASSVVLDRQERMQELAWTQSRRASRRAVQEYRLRADAHRVGVDESGNTDVLDERTQAFEREPEVGSAIAQVAPEGNRDGDRRISRQSSVRR